MDHKKRVLKPSAGMTLLEVLVAVGILAVIMIAMFEVLSRQGKLAAEELNEIDSQRNLRRAFTDIVFELSDARIYAVADDGLSVTYGKPRILNGVPVMNADGSVSFGVMTDVGFVADAPGTQTARYTLTFADVAGTLIEENNDNVKEDLNNDGDQNDRFVFGEFAISANVAGPVNFTESRAVSARLVREIPNGAVFYVRRVGGRGVHQADTLPIDVNNNGVYEPADGDTYTDLNGNGIYDKPDCAKFKDNEIAAQQNNVFDVGESTESNLPNPTKQGSVLTPMAMRIRLVDLDLRLRDDATLGKVSKLRIGETLIQLRNQLRK